MAKTSLAIKPSCYSCIRAATTSKEIWETLQKEYERKSTYRKLSLSRKLHRIRLEDYRTMSEYINEILSIVQQLADIDKEMDDEDVATCLLNGLPDDYEPMIMGLEATHDQNKKITSEAVKSLLLDNACRKESIDHESALITKSKSKYSGTNKKKKIPNFVPVCHECKKEGHIRPKCPQLKKANQKKNDDNTDNKNNTKALLYTVSMSDTALASTISLGDDDWGIDSCCTVHMSKRKDSMTNYCDDVKSTVTIADKSTMSGVGVGNVDVDIVCDNKSVEKTVTDVLHVPDCTANLLSVSKIAEKGKILIFDDKKCYIYDKADCSRNRHINAISN